VDQIVAVETLIIQLLLLASVVAVVVRRLRVPYTVSLVVAGLLITSAQPVRLELTAELILAVFVPPLVFEAAFKTQLRHLLDDLPAILMLAIPGVLLTTVAVGLVVAACLPVSLPTALLFGALMSATDPVAVVALFRKLGVPRRLAVIVEGESLLNDGTSIVVFHLILAAALSPNGAGLSDPYALLPAAAGFLRVAAGGLLVGLCLGWLTARVIAWLDDYLIETTLTTVLAFGSYLVAEQWKISGVLAVVGAGLVNGNIGPRGMTPTTRVVLYNFWEYLAFIVNSLVFLLIGSQVNLRDIAAHLWPLSVAVFAVLGSRALVVYGLSWLFRRRGRDIPWGYRHVLFWGGLRGAIGLALALSLPEAVEDREQLRVMAFGVVLVSILVQGATMAPLVRRLGLAGREEGALEYERRQGRLMAAQAARQRLRQLSDSGLISATVWETVRPELDGEIERRLASQRDLLRERPDLEAEILADVREEALRAERAALMTLLSEGMIGDEAFEELIKEVDARLERAVEAKDGMPEPRPRHDSAPQGGEPPDGVGRDRGSPG
jgi:monovalent cation:H+ antiporter, CPA1 family